MTAYCGCRFARRSTKPVCVCMWQEHMTGDIYQFYVRVGEIQDFTDCRSILVDVVQLYIFEQFGRFDRRRPIFAQFSNIF